MSDPESPVLGEKFQNIMQQFATENQWKLTDLTDRRAILRFGMPSGRTQMLYVIRYGTVLEFSVLSIAKYDAEDQIPHALSSLLMRRNAQRMIGFWCIEELRGQYVYSCMYNAEMDSLDSAYFGRIAVALAGECDEFEEGLLKSME